MSKINNNIRSENIRSFLSASLASELAIDIEMIEDNVPFVEMGLDSIIGVIWIRKINTQFGLSIPATKIYSYPTMQEFSVFILEECNKQTDRSPNLGITTPEKDIIAMLRESVAKELDLAEGDIDNETPFLEMGLDSITGVTWTRKINTHFQLSLSATKIYSYPTIHELSKYLLSETDSALRKSEEKIKQAAQLKEEVSSKSTDIAIIGMSGAFPKAANIEEYWQNIITKKDCISEVPASRWSIEKYYDPTPGVPGKSYCKWMGLLENADEFDPRFFNISPIEAEYMDPQQRILLQESWRCFEDAGYDPGSFSGTQCGVFIGCSVNGYGMSLDESELNAHQNLGNNSAILASRISYFLNLRGPCLSIDTSCSSSLVAMASACDSLLLGDSDVALAGGVWVIPGPGVHVAMSQLKALSPDGRCFPFDHRANGFVPAEGIGILLLKRLQDALSAGDQIHGVIKGWGVNQDGKSNGITAPNADSQTQLEKRVYEKFGINPEEIQLIEAHGTGTALGDPVEINGLVDSFKYFTKKHNYCALGSVKGNMGHAACAAGVAGAIKILMALKNKILPPSIQYQQLNPHIDLQETPFFVNTESRNWDIANKKLRCAAISSFGYSGTNAHMVLAEAPFIERKRPVQSAYLIVLSARTKAQLKQQAQQLVDHVEKMPNLNLGEISYTLLAGRKHFQYRLSIVVKQLTELTRALRAWLETGSELLVKTGDKKEILLKDNDVQKNYSNLSAIAELYTQGYKLDYAKLFGETIYSKVSLPTYPFEKESYWLPSKKIKGERSAFNIGQLHPLVHQNISTAFETIFTSKFNGAEFFLRDHKIQEMKLLPGVAYLELAREALTRSFYDLLVEQSENKRLTKRLQLQKIVWLRPAILTNDSLSLNISIIPHSDLTCNYDIYSVSENGEEILYHQGKGQFLDSIEGEMLDLERLRSQCIEQGLNPEQLYSIYAEVGLNYGSAQKSIVDLRIGVDDKKRPQVLAKLQLPSSLQENQGDFQLHPSILDGALQASLALNYAPGVSSDHKNQTRLPFALETLQIFAKTPNSAYAWIHYSEGSHPGDAVQKLDISICDERGQICMEFRGFSSRGLSTNELHTNDSIVLMRPEWELAPLDTKNTHTPSESLGEHRVLLIGALNNEKQEALEAILPEAIKCEYIDLDSHSLDKRYQHITEKSLTSLKELLDKKFAEFILVQVLIIENGTGNDHSLSGISGLLKTASLEQPKLLTQCIEWFDETDLASLATAIQDNARELQSKEIRYRDGQRQVKRLREIPKISQSESSVPWHDQGVYLITGGLGGLGLIFAKAIAAETKHATVILTGRAALDASKKSYLSELHSLGLTVDYQQVDVTDLRSAQELMVHISLKYGTLSGIIHSAGVIKDNFILKKSIEELEQVLAPKVHGLVNLDEVSKDQALEFFICFSSLTGALGNPGQADYAAANGFMDTYANYRNQLVKEGKRHGKTLSINWPLWKEGGMKVDAVVQKQLRELGLVPLSTSLGLQAFNHSLATQENQVLVFAGNPLRIAQLLALPARTSTKTMASAHPEKVINEQSLLREVQRILIQQVSAQLKVQTEDIDLDSELSEYGFDSISLTEFANYFNQNYEMALVPTIFFEYPTLGSFSAYLVHEYRELFTKALKINSVSIKQSETITLREPSFTPIHHPRHRPSIANLISKGSLKEEESIKTIPIAVIGMSAAFPQAENIDIFWQNLFNGKDCISEIPKARWDWQTVKGHVKWGGFIEGVDQFDPLFFGISPREAISMDPQQRLLMTHAWQALEDAGYAPSSLAGSNTAILVGTAPSGYGNLMIQAQKSEDGYTATGVSGSVGPNRVSFLLDLHGPSEPIETACSSSLVAIHRGVELLRQGKTNLALVGGINTIVSPDLHISYSRAGMLCEDGRCKTFSDQANGYVRGEGVGILVLKTLTAAEADGDHIYGLICESAINHGGRANSLTAPNPKAQAELLKTAYRQAGIDPRSVTYIETHGTGTELGDPVEVNGLKSAFQSLYEETKATNLEGTKCGLGSVKSNIGHLELSAGVAGVIKTLLQMKHKILVKSLHSESINPYIQLNDSPFYIVQEQQPWDALKDTEGKLIPRRAGVSSFGFGGVNAHVVLEEYLPTKKNSFDKIHPALIVLSAKTEEQLFGQAQKLLLHIQNQSPEEVELTNIAYTLQVGRDAMDERLATTVTSLQALEDKLLSLTGENPQFDGWYKGTVKKNNGPLSLFNADPQLQEAVRKWLELNQYDQILELWVTGFAFDWQQLYSSKYKPQRVSLPTYAFAKEKFWIPHASQASEVSHTVQLHPLLHQNTSTAHDTTFTSRFTGEEFFLNDHKVRGVKILSGAAHLEMARAAISKLFETEKFSAIQLQDIVWWRPVAFTDEALALRISVQNLSKTELAYKIYSLEKNEKEMLYSQGKSQLLEASDNRILDLEKLHSLISKETFFPDQIYAAFAKIGLNYGPGHQGIVELKVGLDDYAQAHVLAKLQIPLSVQATIDDYGLHPSIMDSALQASVGLAFLSNPSSESAKPMLPFALETLEILGKPPSTAYAWIRYSKGSHPGDSIQKLDISICDARGLICVEFKGFNSRVLETDELNTNSPTVLIRPKLNPVLPETPVVTTPQKSQMHVESTQGLQDKALRYFKQQLAEALNLGIERLDVDTPTEKYGMDSIMAMELTRHFEKIFGPLSKTLFFEVQTIRALSEYFITQHTPQLQLILGSKFIEPVQSPIIKETTEIPSVQAHRRFSSVLPKKLETNTETEIAIVGMSGRYPQANTLQEYWENLKTGKNCISEIPESRWDHSQYFDTNKDALGKSYCKWGGFIDGVDQFDPLFFNISPREAEYLDPQERLFLQCVYEAIEDAGYTAKNLTKRAAQAEVVQEAAVLSSNVGVFVGVMYEEYQLYGAQAQAVGQNIALSGNPASIANRISYFFNFHGPSMALDTMCSSSLTAIHLACDAIKRGECSLAIAGGVNVSIHPNKYLMLSQGKFASSTGKCESFGVDGDGYVPGEGIGALLLKSKADAIADNDHIYGIIKGSAINHGGKTNGFSVPNPLAQSDVIIKALQDAQVDPRVISYIEAHGTGTSLGDPIEISGLSKAFNQLSDKISLQSCAIGSVKSNIGHCESAAGIASVTKVLLQMKYQQLVPSLHSQTLNPNINFEITPFKVQQTLEEWKRPLLLFNGKETIYPRIAGVSSFGAGGSNAHVIIEEYNPEVWRTVTTNIDLQHPAIIILSAKSEAQLVSQAKNLLAHIETLTDMDLPNIAYTLQVGRDAMDERLAFTVTSLQLLKNKLKGFIAEPAKLNECSRGSVKSNKGALSVFTADEELQEAIGKWVERGKHEKLLDLWVQGLVFDWEKLYLDGKCPQRISLPTYPFSQERCWVDRAQQTQVTQTLGTVEQQHPLVHQNNSTVFELIFSSRFNGAEFFLKDHQVQNIKMFPGVGHLEMARAAIARALGLPLIVEDDDKLSLQNLQLQDVVWLRPATIKDNSMLLQVRIIPQSDTLFDYTIFSLDENKEEILYSQGKAQLLETSSSKILDLKKLGLSCSLETFQPEQIYSIFAQLGLNYGQSYKGIIDLTVGVDDKERPQVLAKLQLPSSLQKTQKEFQLHPIIMDTALQASIGLDLLQSSNRGSSSKPMLPFALETLEIFSRTPSSAYAWIRYSEGSHPGDAVQKLDISICDEQGQICVELRGFSARTLSNELNMDSVMVLMHPHWENIPLLEKDAHTSSPFLSKHRVLLIGEFNHQPKVSLQIALPGSVEYTFIDVTKDALDNGYQEIIRKTFEMIQQILRSKLNEPALLQVVILSNIKGFAGISSLLKTASLEQPKLLTQCIEWFDETDLASLATAIQDNASELQSKEIRYRDGQRQVKRLREIPKISQSESSVPWHDQGVYLITGGLGGLGLIFAKAIAAETKHATVILTGRAALDASKKSYLSELQSLGLTVDYQQVDVTDLRSAQELMAHISLKHGSLSGIIHSAGVIKDNFILKKSIEELEQVLAPKVHGLVNLDEASKDQALEFFICFSSLTGALGNPGQADYAAANGFMDAYANYRNQLVKEGKRHGKTLSINWPLWKEGGMKVDAVVQKQLRELGLAPLSTSLGLQAFNHSLATQEDQVLVFAGKYSAIIQPILETQDVTAPQKYQVHTGSNHKLQDQTSRYFKQQLAAALKLDVDRLDIDIPIEKYGMDSIIAMELMRYFEKTFGPLSKTLFFEVQTIRALSEYFITQHHSKLQALFGSDHVVPVEPTIANKITQNKRIQDRSFFSSTLSKKLETSTETDIAIIGMSGCYPQANNLQEYWENLKAGKDCISEIPGNRWDHTQYFDPNKDALGKSYCNWGGFIDGVDQFDPLFFNISPREAEIMDPQQRLFLESVWQLLESSGVTQESIQQQYQRRVGVYVGSMYQMYHADKDDIARHAQTSVTSYNMIANRISYFFGLEGPSLAIDNMCASSAMAIHLACMDLLRGESLLAIAGGVNLTIHPNKYIALSQAQMIGSHKKSRSFCDGDGYLPAEGVGAVLLKPLAAAIRDKDTIHAVIRSSTSLHGGRSNSFMTPSFNTQVNVIEQCLARAKVEPNTISYIEAASNGSALGDLIEVNALTKVFCNVEKTISLGSVKANLGHPEAASGIAQLTKVVLQLQHQKIVPLFKAGSLNPNLQFENTPFKLNEELEDWRPLVIEEKGQSQILPNRALINSFGAGGSYVSLLIEEYAGQKMQQKTINISAPQLIILSAKDEERLCIVIRNIINYLKEHPSIPLSDMAYTLQVGREAMSQRIAMVVNSQEELIMSLKVSLGEVQDETHRSLLLASIYKGNSEDDYPKLQNLISGQRGDEFVRSLISDQDLARLAAFWVKGGTVPWKELHGHNDSKIVSLPTYPFDHKRYWVGDSNLETDKQQVLYSDLSDYRHEDSLGTGFESYLINFFSETLSISENKIPKNKDLQSLGVDSILLLRLQRIIEQKFALQLSSRELIECSTIKGLSECLTKKAANSTECKIESNEPAEINNKKEMLKVISELEEKNNQAQILDDFKKGKIGLEAIKKTMRIGS